MNTVHCTVEGCQEVYQTPELVSPIVRFTCRYHIRSVQVQASGRIYDPVKDNQDAAVHLDKHQFQRRFDSFKHLRSVVDGDEAFVQGHQTTKTRNPERKIPTPDWMFNDASVEQFLAKLFPTADRDLDQRMRLAVYRGVILRWFRGGQSDASVEDALNLNPGTAGRVVQDIRAVLAGRRRDGRKRTFGKPGRPKKSSVVAPQNKDLDLIGLSCS